VRREPREGRKPALDRVAMSVGRMSRIEKARFDKLKAKAEALSLPISKVICLRIEESEVFEGKLNHSMQVRLGCIAARLEVLATNAEQYEYLPNWFREELEFVGSYARREQKLLNGLSGDSSPTSESRSQQTS